MRAAFRLGSLVLACGLGISGAAAADTEPGDLWENTTQMTMEGMAMPPTTSRYCQPRSTGWTEPPGAMQDDCEVVDWKMTGSTATWSMRCKDGTSGTGEMTFEGRTAYRGTMTVNSSEGSMAMKLSGRRVGDCDAGVARRQGEAMQHRAEAMQRQAEQSHNDAMATMCRQGAEEIAVDLFVPPNGVCTSPADKAALCARFRTESGFDGVAGQPPYENPQLAKAASFCGTETEEVREELCTGALAKRSYPFLGRHCPELRKTVAEAECAGRKFTTIPDPGLRGFCMSYASQTLSAEGQPADQDKKKESKGKKVLKGLFGR